MSDLTTGWRKRQIALDIKAENARELGLDYEPEKNGPTLANGLMLTEAIRARGNV
jgi:hypothetical protein